MDLLARAAALRPDAVALDTGARAWTFTEMDLAARGVAEIVGRSYTRSAVALWGDRNPETVAAMWGVIRAGINVVPVDSGLPAPESMRLTRMVDAGGLWTPPEGGIDAMVERGRRARAGGSEGHGEWIVFTSGTTGRKGVRITQAMIDAHVAASRERLGNGSDDVWLGVLPLFHVGGLAILWRQAASGAAVELHERFDAELAAEALQRVAFASVVPTMLRRLLPHVGSVAARGVLVGGGPLRSDLLDASLAAGLPALQTYGMTETTSQVTTVAPGDARRDAGTAGRPLDGVDIAIGDGGRIAVRGGVVTPGYVGETERVPGEWFETQDRGLLDDEGRLTVLGRLDRVVVSGGENVDLDHVERTLAGAPGVVAVRVGSRPDPEWGVAVVAEIDGDLDAARDAAGSLARHERPKEWRRGVSGKASW